MVQILVQSDGERVPVKDTSCRPSPESSAVAPSPCRRAADSVIEGYDDDRRKWIGTERRDKVEIHGGGGRICPQTRGSKFGNFPSSDSF